MAFHPDKCNVLSISTNKDPPIYNYTLHGHTLQHVDKAKYLGVTIQSDLKWHSHINNICNKANSTLGFLRRNLNISSTSVKELAYKSLVRPSLEYASSVWDPYLTEDINKLEKIQRKAARYVANRHRNTSSVSDMINNLEWRELANRRTDARLAMLYKITITIPSINPFCLVLQSSLFCHVTSQPNQGEECLFIYDHMSDRILT